MTPRSDHECKADQFEIISAIDVDIHCEISLTCLGCGVAVAVGGTERVVCRSPEVRGPENTHLTTHKRDEHICIRPLLVRHTPSLLSIWRCRRCWKVPALRATPPGSSLRPYRTSCSQAPVLYQSGSTNAHTRLLFSTTDRTLGSPCTLHRSRSMMTAITLHVVACGSMRAAVATADAYWVP